MDALTIEQLTKSYGENGPLALDDMTFSVKDGEFFGLLGPNGAGKTTLIGILTSLVRPSSGSVKVFGKDLFENFRECKRYFGMMPQEFNFNIFEKPEQIIVNQAGYYGMEKKEAQESAQHWMKELELWEHRHKPAMMLSGGMKRRLMIARALVHNPKILILDEPTAGVDISLRRSMWRTIRGLNEKGITIILTTHYLEEAEKLCERIGIIRQGKLIKLENTRKLLDSIPNQRVTLSSKAGFPEGVLVDLSLKGEHVDKWTIDVDLGEGETVTALLAKLADQNIIVDHVQNAVNRLEEVFVHLVEDE